MTPLRALETVTSRAADVICPGERNGRLAAGRDADLLIVDGDPVTDPGTIHRIRAVHSRGRLVT